MLPLIAALVARPVAHIYQFEDFLAEKLWQLDTAAHAAPLREEADGFLSVDDFLYARCAVVANGPEYFQKILQNPLMMPADETFEPLLYAASDAFEQKTGQEFDYSPTWNYETGSNKAGWSNPIS